MLKKSISDIDVRGKVCLVRVDYNVPLTDDWEIMDDVRIKESLNTIHNLIWMWAKILLMTHLWRPDWKFVEALKVHKLAKHLSSLLWVNGIEVLDYMDVELSKKKISEMSFGQVCMLENLRFHPDEETNPYVFWKFLSQFADIFVNEAFSVSHREHGSLTWITNFLPSVWWVHLHNEDKFIKAFACTKQTTPYVVIIGWKKAEDKIPVMKELIEKADYILVAGGIANTFLKAWGYDIGSSFCEDEMLDTVKQICYKAMQTNTAIVLPDDVVVTDSYESEKKVILTVDVNKIPRDFMTADIGPKTIKKYSEILERAGSVLWTWPIWVYRYPEFRWWNDAILDAIAQSKVSCLAGWWDTIASIKDHPCKNYVSHISTGWGATLHYIQHWGLPWINSLHDF